MELALAHGLGLDGVGAPAAVRAFLLERLIAFEPGGIVIVIPALDLADLFGFRSPKALPPLPLGLEVTADIDDAIDLLEIQALARAFRSPVPEHQYHRWTPTYVLIALAARFDVARLQVALDLGAGYGVAGLLLGSWRPGVTVSVDEDGRAGAGGVGLGKLMRNVPLGGLDAELGAERLTRLGRQRPRLAPPST